MPTEDLRRHSRWILRVLEWDDARARYPNLWHGGMPVQVLAFRTMAGRLRLGDLVAVYHPASRTHPKRAERFLGLSRVTALRPSHEPKAAWVDLETAHRFSPPLDLRQSPRRVFLCCDPGWPEREVALFRKVFETAVAAGWQPEPEDLEASHKPVESPETAALPERAVVEGTPAEDLGAPTEAVNKEEEAEEEEEEEPGEPSRSFAGASLGGGMRDRRLETWLAVVGLRGERLRVDRLEPAGRVGLHGILRDADAALPGVEAVGLAFPFGLPLPFAESLLGGSFPEEGWWALARKFERMSRPEYLVALQEFRDAHGELKRHTDEIAGAPSPLHRADADLGARTYHGIRMIAEERSRYAIRPFETAQGRRFLEVNPAASARALAGEKADGDRRRLLEALGGLERFPVDVPRAVRTHCLARPEALDAVLAARSAAMAVLTGEADRGVEDLAGEHVGAVRVEGWIYGRES